jgi:hypothetical protein
MSESMPCAGFKWGLNPEDFKIENVKEDSEKGHILEVDIEYPKEFYHLHNDYPFCSEQVHVQRDMLSDYCETIAKEYNLSNGKFTKLIQNLRNKEKYMIRERCLKQAVDAGLII